MDSSVIKSQLTSLKKRVKSQRTAGTETERAESKDAREIGGESLSTQPTESNQARHSDGERGTIATEAEDDTTRQFHEMALVDPPMLTSSGGAIIKWSCQECSNECIPVMRESRCLCGHRLKEHKASTTGKPAFPCSSRGCRCKHFLFLVAEGAWILRCRCKHKHIEHDCGPGPHKCDKCSGCSGFDSPWVCNCGHTWSSHKQQTVVVTERNAEVVLGGQPNKKQHFYRQDGLEG